MIAIAVEKMRIIVVYDRSVRHRVITGWIARNSYPYMSEVRLVLSGTIRPNGQSNDCCDPQYYTERNPLSYRER